MGEIYAAGDIRSALRTFQEYMRDLSEAKFDQFQTKLRLLLNYCEKDDHFRLIAQQLHGRAPDMREWFAQASAAGTNDLPQEPVARLASQYRLLLDLKQQKIDLRNFLSTLFTGASIQEAHGRFRAAWLEPMQHGFQRIFTVMEREIGAKERVDLLGLVDAAFSEASSPAKPAAAAAKAAPAPAKPASPAPAPAAPAKPAKVKKSAKEVAAEKAAAALAALDVEGLVKHLEKTLKGAKDLAAKVKSDAETDVKIMKLALSKHVPDMAVVGRVAEPLQRAGGKIAEVAGALVERAQANGSK